MIERRARICGRAVFFAPDVDGRCNRRKCRSWAGPCEAKWRTLGGEKRQQGDELRAEIRAGDKRLAGLIEELGVHMRVLHEDVIGRIAVLGEAINGRKDSKRKR